VNDYIPALCRQPHLIRILRVLANLKAGTKTDIVKPLSDLASNLNRKSMVILISDMLEDEERIIKTLQRLRAMGNDVIVFHVLDDAELHFNFQEATEFVDSESSETFITSPASIRDAYLENFNNYLSYCKKKCQSSGVDYCLLNTSQPLDTALYSYISRRAKSF
jgi:uncharacterized protein (DUF58 family)